MSIILKKGCTVNLSGRIRMSLDWDCALGQDFDIWALPFNDDGATVGNAVNFVHRKSDKGRICLAPCSSGAEDALVFELGLSYPTVLIGATIFSAIAHGRRLKNGTNVTIRIYNKTKEEICRYTAKADTTVLFGVLLHTDSRWVFVPIGEGRTYLCIESVSKDETVSDLIRDCRVKLNNKSTIMEVKKSMAVSLNKGGRVSLAKTAASMGINNLVSVSAGLHWDVNRFDGGADFDLDAMVFMLGADGKCRNEKDFVFYGNYEGAGVKHSGDERRGSKEGDDETVEIDLNVVPADIQRIVFCVTIYDAVARKQNFGQVENCGIHIYDRVTGTDLLRYDLGEDYSTETAIVVAELYRNGGDWKLNAIGSGFNEGLVALCANYGIQATE